MAQLTACDNCGKTAATKDGLLGWWEIKAAGELLLWFGESFPPHTLCSWDCVAAFAARHALARGADPHRLRFHVREEVTDD